MKKMLKHKVWSNPIHFLGFGFGSGLSPFAPGTMGTIAAIPLYLLMIHYLSSLEYLLLTVLITLIGIPICDKVSKDLGVHDFSGIVWDEITGFLITMLWIPFSWTNVLLGFALFRVFDILKPWPIRVVDEKVKGGFGIMIDDVIAAIFAWICLQGIIYLT